MKNLLDRRTFEIGSPENGEPIIPTTIKCKLKYKSDGTLEKFKCLACVHGDLQKRTDTEDTWSAMTSKRGLRMFIASAAVTTFKIFQLDFICAFLQTPVRSPVYVMIDKLVAEMVPEFKQYCGISLRLIKSMYGQTLSGKWWFLELLSYLISDEMAFIQSDTDQTLFVREEEDGSFTKFMVYVDDGLYYNSGSKAEFYRKQFEKELLQKFEVNFIGQAHWFLSMRIRRDIVGNISLDQSRYAINIAKKFLGDSESHKPVKRPLPADFVASKEDCAQSDEEVTALESEYRLNYSSALGSLVYEKARQKAFSGNDTSVTVY